MSTTASQHHPFDDFPEDEQAPAELDTLAPPADPEAGTRSRASEARQESTAAQLAALAVARFTIIRDDAGDVYGIDRERPGIAIPLYGKNGVGGEIRRLYYDDTGRPASQAAVSDTLAVLEAEGARKDPEPIYLRHGQTMAGTRVLDLGRDAPEAVVLDSSGWHVVASPPVIFRRNKATNPMPFPVAGGTLDRFRALINTDEDGFRLLVAWMLVALCEDVQSPILCLIGQQGSAKTSAMRAIINLVDSSGAPLKAPPRDEDSWALTAKASAVIGIDNFSSCPPWFSDTLARTVSGDAVIKRSLYSDQDITITSYRRPIALTSISPEGLRADVADRLATVELHPIPKTARRLDKELAAEFRAIQPETLGALLDLLVSVERKLETIERPAELPRLADAGLRFHALDSVTGWNTLESFIESQDHAAEDVLDADVFAAALITHARDSRVWEGTASALLRAISPERPPRSWPRNARAVSVRLQRLAPPLLLAGVHVEQMERRGTAREWRITSDTPADARLCEVCHYPLHDALPKSITMHPTCADTLDTAEKGTLL